MQASQKVIKMLDIAIGIKKNNEKRERKMRNEKLQEKANNSNKHL